MIEVVMWQVQYPKRQWFRVMVWPTVHTIQTRATDCQPWNHDNTCPCMSD